MRAFTDEYRIKEVISVRGTTKMCQSGIEIDLVRVGYGVVVNMHKNEEKLSVLDPRVKSRVSFGTL